MAAHPIEEQIKVVNETLRELNSFDKPTLIIFNKIDAFTYTVRDAYDLSPVLRENYSLEDLKRTWMASDNNHRTVFISARQSRRFWAEFCSRTKPLTK
jgi:GTP-binding protein HflX